MTLTSIPSKSSPDDKKKTFVVIPAYNEDKVIKEVVSEVLQYGYSIVIVDDGSAVYLKDILCTPDIFILRHAVNLGQGAALQTGIEFAVSQNATYIVTFDADGQHKASEIETLLLPLKQGEADIVLGSRFKEKRSNIPLQRKYVLQTARYINFIFTGLLLSDAHNGFRALTAKCAQKIRITQNGMAHATEFLAEIRKNKFKYIEIPVTISYSNYAKKKGQNDWASFRIFFDIIIHKFFK